MEKKYSVFVSSTYTDLQEERKKVIDALLQMNCFPIGMEMHKRLFKVDVKKIGGDTGYAGTANRNLCKEMGI